MLKVLAKTTTRKEGSPVTDTIITLNEQTLKNQLGELVRASVEETLNKMLDAEADHLANAGFDLHRKTQPVIMRVFLPDVLWRIRSEFCSAGCYVA